MGKVALIIGIIIFLLGVFYALAPHSMHLQYGLDFGLDHMTHQLMGVVLLVVGAVIVWKKR